jgi:hypothetical protein
VNHVPNIPLKDDTWRFFLDVQCPRCREYHTEPARWTHASQRPGIEARTYKDPKSGLLVMEGGNKGSHHGADPMVRGIGHCEICWHDVAMERVREVANVKMVELKERRDLLTNLLDGNRTTLKTLKAQGETLWSGPDADSVEERIEHLEKQLGEVNATIDTWRP